ncbi:MAG: methyltransferase domain-containing protein [bacterium]
MRWFPLSASERVRDYFNRYAQRFDAIYEPHKSVSQRVGDSLFRRVVVERLNLIRNLAPSRGPWTVLDVGCGSGRYTVALAEIGAARVVGVDAAPEMIKLARFRATDAGVDGRCEFHTAEFLEFAADEQFDVVVATGYFDYLDVPFRHLRKMLMMCQGKVFASFPKRWEVRVPARKLRIALGGGFVRFYSHREVMDLVAEANLSRERLSLIDLGRDWIAVLRVA